MIDESKNVTRREFLKIAGIAGATIGVGTGLGGLLAACGEEETTTTTAGATTTAGPATTAGPTTTAAPASTTTVSAGPTMGREIKVGFVTPQTGPLAAFGIPDKYCASRAIEAIGDGLVCGDGQKHPIDLITKDGQSDTQRAAAVAGDLINNNKIDLMLVTSTADQVNPVADQCETSGVPCLSTDVPWQNFIYGRGGDPTKQYQWTYNFFWGLEDIIAAFLACFDTIPTNNRVAVLLSNSAPGNAWRDPWMAGLEANGYTGDWTDQYPVGSEDYTAQISQFKKNGDEVALGLFTPPDFTTFWKQCIQQSFNPKTGIWSMCLEFPQAAEALGDLCINLGTETMWTPAYPYTSPLVNETGKQFADKFEEQTGMQWTQPLQHFAVFEWGVDVLRRTKDVDDPKSYIDAVLQTKLTTISGDIDFTVPVASPDTIGPCRITPNNYKSPVCVAQWRKGTGKWPYDQIIVGNGAAPNIPTEDKFLPLTYS
jgi:branched-chain amino acid transport system substrate-binding protein